MKKELKKRKTSDVKNQLLNKRIPTILGIILVLLCIPLTTFVVKNQIIFINRASNSQEPQNVKMTNISNEAFTITYLTSGLATGSISYGHDKKLEESGLEDVDKEKGSFSPKKVHSISVKHLIPDTKYYLTIISGSGTFLDNGTPFEATTGPNISSSSAKQQIIKGKIVLPDGSIPSEAIVYLNADNSQFLSSTTTKDGTFIFSLEDLRTDDLSSYFNVNENTVFNIVATNGSLISTASASLSKNDFIPTITLSNNYDFVQEVSPTASKSAKSSESFPSIVPSKDYIKPQIINPKDNQSINNQKPQFRGTSLPNGKVEIIIHSPQELTTQVTADSNGNWTYQPSSSLSPGEHTITIRTRDSSGILRTITQSFTVFAAGNPTNTPVTPSVIPTATPTRKIMPTSIPTLAPLPSPTITALIPLLTITPIPSPIIIPIKTKGGLPPTGTSSILLIVGGIITAFVGLALLFSIHRASV